MYLLLSNLSICSFKIYLYLVVFAVPILMVFPLIDEKCCATFVMMFLGQKVNMLTLPFIILLVLAINIIIFLVAKQSYIVSTNDNLFKKVFFRLGLLKVM